MATLDKKFFDFNVKTVINEQNKAVLIFEIDYRDIWFVKIKDYLEATFALSVEIINEDGETVLGETKKYPISEKENDIGSEKIYH